MSLRRRVRRLIGPRHHDEIGVAHRLLHSVHAGVMVDVGAHHGSALMPFASRGWRIKAFEPDPTNRAILSTHVSAMPSVEIDARAVSTVDGEVVSLFTSDVSSGISSLAAFHPSHHVTAEVSTVRLDTALDGLDRVDFLKTDVEGHDLFALQSFPWGRLHPAVVLSEFEDRKTEQLGYRFDDIAGYLRDLGYAVVVSEWYPIVEYGQTHRWRRAFLYPGRLATPLAWGNLIGVDPSQSQLALRLAKRIGIQQRALHAIQRCGSLLRKRSP